MMENPGPACLRCVGLDDLEFLSAGDALLTRRVKAKSARRAVVVRFSKSRRRYERQGLLVEPQALMEAQRELALCRRRDGAGPCDLSEARTDDAEFLVMPRMRSNAVWSALSSFGSVKAGSNRRYNRPSVTD
jgi:hypothetical protein